MNKKTTIGIILFPFLCLFISFFVLLSDPAFTYLLLDNPEAIQPTKQLIEYFFHKAEIPSIFATDEKSHLEDVRQLISYAYYLFGILIIVVVYCMLDNWRKIIRWGTGLLAALLLLVALIPFDTFFTTFHNILFPQGNWQFAADSTLMQFYPQIFFANYCIAIAMHALIVCLILLYITGQNVTSS